MPGVGQDSEKPKLQKGSSVHKRLFLEWYPTAPSMNSTTNGSTLQPWSDLPLPLPVLERYPNFRNVEVFRTGDKRL